MTCQRLRPNTVGVRVPNTPLSSRGRGADWTPRRGVTAAPVCCSGWFGTDLRPNKAAKTGLPHPGPRLDRTPAGHGRRATRPPDEPAGPQPQAGRGALAPRLRTGHGPFPLRLTTTCQRLRTRNLSVGECRTPRSAAGAAGATEHSGEPHAAPVCCSGWFGMDPAYKAARTRLPHEAAPAADRIPLGSEPP